MSETVPTIHPIEETSKGGAALVRHPTRASSLLLLLADLLASAVLIAVLGGIPTWAVGFVAVVFASLMVRGHYRTRMARDAGEDFALIVGAVAAGVLVVAVGVTAFPTDEPILGSLVGASLAMLVLLMVSRTLAFALLRRLRRRGHLRSRALVVGTGSIAREIGVEFAHRRDYGVDIAGYVASRDLKSEARLPGPVIGNLVDLADLARITSSDRVIVTLGTDADGGVVDALRTLRMPDCSIFVMPQLSELGMGADTMTPDRARGYALVRIGRSAHPVIGVRMKRLFDIAAAGLALLVLAPLLALAALAVRLSSKGPILFRQERVGQHGRHFELLKFRSMKVNDDSDTAWTPQASAGGVTKIGGFLRSSSLDELPQLLNIFRGDMSVVGPRPERPAFVAQFEKTVPGYVHRHRMPVGLTGLAQVRGLRGDTPIQQRVKFDNLYIDQWAFFGDMRLIVMTFWSIVRQRAYAEAEIDMSRVMAEVDEQEQVVIDLLTEERIRTSQVGSSSRSA